MSFTQSTPQRGFHRLRRRSRANGALGLAPLVDVVLLLLIFLLISARFDHRQVIQVDLPATKDAGSDRSGTADRRIVTLFPDGALAWNESPIDRAGLAEILRAEPPESRLLPLVIQGDREASLGAGLGLLEFVRGLGYPHCVFQVRANSETP